MHLHATLPPSEPARIDRRVELPRSNRRIVRVGAGREMEPVIVGPGRHVEMHCPVSGVEEPRVGWFKRQGNHMVRVRPGRGVTLTETKLEEMSTLVLAITSISARHYGRYFCRTNNIAGEDQARVVLAGE